MKKIKLLTFVLLLIAHLAVSAGREDRDGLPLLSDSDSTSTPLNSMLIPKRVEDVGSKWARTCALCHATGVGGAPRLGIWEEWRPRFEKGKELLLTHTIEGFNDMPPLGYCMSCDRDDFLSLIDFMTGEVR